MEEKDLFDMFREGSENLTEQPATDSWQRLERRLASSKATKKRKPLPLQLMVVVATVALLITAGIVNWVVIKDREAHLKNKDTFFRLQFLVGKWSASEGNVIDELVFEGDKLTKDVQILRGIKTVRFKDLPVQTDTFLIENKGKRTVFTTKNQAYELKNVNNAAFLFIASDGSVMRLRQDNDRLFTLSFGEGQVFLYKK